MSTSTTSKIIKLFNILNNLVVTLVAFFIAVFAFMFFLMSFDRDPIDIEFKVISPKIRFGDLLKIEQRVTRYEVCATKSEWTIYDSAGNKISFPLGETPASGNVGTEKPFTRSLKIDKTMGNNEVKPGIARARLVLGWQCPGNYYQAIFPKTRVYDDLFFEILEEDR